ncbi:hypothetical protein [Arthrobacter alpinus]|uniref:hypothetical protein n=1 Tax=Arthrobacter alpinus TaxID=656366 RepID=UPI001EF52F5A|nr:hypothetical protein [Arthrobacter alpinus]
MRWTRTTAAAGAILLAAVGVVSCSQFPASQACFPPPFSLSQDTASAGGSISISAEDATCDPRYGDGAQIQVEVMDASGATIVTELAPMNDAGGFSITLDLPATAVPGRGMVTAYPHNLDWCDDTGRNNRVGRAAGTGIERVSCVMPSAPLTITSKL